MINNIIRLYIKLSYFSQRMAGWKNYKEGFENLLFTNIFFLSSGIFVSLILPFVSKIGKTFSFVIFIVFAILYYIFFKKPFLNLLYRKVKIELLDRQFEKLSYFKKVLSVVFSVGFLICSVLLMVLIIYVFGVFWKATNVI